MISKYYKCTFISNVILRGSSNTQGNILKLDFIPGSNFLGIVANDYENLSNSFEIFHSGCVKFGDAHVLIDDKISYKIPLSFHKVKLGEEKYNKIYLSDDETQELINNQKQLQQIRNGYMNEDFLYYELLYNYHQKSSHDKEKRRSKDEGMFGYSSLEKGTSWAFKIVYENEKYINEVEKNLLGKRLLGKAKTSEFGQVFIEKFEDVKEVSSFKPKDDLTYIYAKSRIALIDNNANAIALQNALDLGLKSGEICWDKTYIKTRNYSPYNAKKQTHEMMRFFIEKGSVIAIKGLKEQLPSFIGKFQNEGYGEILVNPKFLEKKELNLQKNENKNQITNNTYSDNLIKFLEAKEKYENAMFEVANTVLQNYKKLISPSRSQWGVIRELAATSKDKKELIFKIKEFVNHGISKKQWEKTAPILISLIEKTNNPKELTKLLAMSVSKYTKGGKNE